MPLPQKHIYTIHDIYALPDGHRAELIDGQIYNMAPPSTRHQDISMALCTLIHNYISSGKGDCKVYAAPFAVFLNDNAPLFYRFTDTIKVHIFDDLYIDFCKLSEGLR